MKRVAILRAMSERVRRLEDRLQTSRQGEEREQRLTMLRKLTVDERKFLCELMTKYQVKSYGAELGKADLGRGERAEFERIWFIMNDPLAPSTWTHFDQKKWLAFCEKYGLKPVPADEL